MKRGRGRPRKISIISQILQADQLLMPLPGVIINEIFDGEMVEPAELEPVTTFITCFARLFEDDLIRIESNSTEWFNRGVAFCVRLLNELIIAV